MDYNDILNPVQGNGVYAADLPLFGGQHIWKAVPVILDALKVAGRLMDTTTITHSYPHCWRHKTPVIYRAAAQWFIRMDEGEGVFTDPRKAREDPAPDRAGSHRADQLLPGKRPGPPARHDRRPSRLVHLAPAQLGRAHPLLPAQGHGRAAPRTMEIIDQAADMVEQGGIEAWSRVSAEDILGAEEAKHYTKSTDILEVWFDSGSTFWHVLRGTTPTCTTTRAPRPTCTWKATTSTAAGSTARCCWPRAIFGRAPYRGLLTHGFTVDGQGKKMSKSLGNTVARRT
jgi:isoleucyl-tRNA synthetase